MDNNQNQTNNNNPAQVAPTTPVSIPNNVASDILNTQSVDPFSLPKEQMEKDLELLKVHDVDTQTEDMTLNDPTLSAKPKFVPFVKMKVTDIDVLKMKNPFKGE